MGLARPAYKTSYGAYPSQGNRILPVRLDFTNVQTINDDLSPEMMNSSIETISGVAVDNSQNGQPLQIIFESGWIVQVLPGKQGVYPVFQWGSIQYTAKTTGAVIIPVFFLNYVHTYFEWATV